MTYLDKYSKEQLEQIVKESESYKDVARKVGYTNSCSGDTLKKVQKKINDLGISTKHFVLQKVAEKRTPENTLIENSTASQKVLRKIYFEGQYSPYICSICGQEPYWNGQSLTLILDHIDGNNTNDVLTNLRWVCPNCNQQLPTTGYKKIRVKEDKKNKYFCIDCGIEITKGALRCLKCSKKKQQKVDRPDRDTLKNMIRQETFLAIGQKYGVSDNSIRKWCDSYNLPRTKKEINHYSDLEWENI